MRKIMTALAWATLPIPLASASAQTAPIMVDGAVLDVSAQGRTTRVPDVATIRAGVVAQGSTAAAALSDNAARMARVLAAVKRAGVAPRDVQTANVSLSPQYRYGEGKPPEITGYQANNSVTIRFREIGKAGSILDALVAEGANQIDGPTLSLDHPDAALDEARTDAVKRARARAELYARAAGLSVARILSISEGGQNAGTTPQPIFYARAMKADAAPTQIAAGEADVTVDLTVRFLLK